MTPPDALKVLVVDDSVIYRRALSRALAELPGIDVVGTACDGSEAVQKIKELRPCVVTLDLEMPHMDGLATLRALREQGLKTHVLILSAFGGEKRTVEALCLGAEDYLIKPSFGSGPTGPMQNLQSLLAAKLAQFARQPNRAPRKPATSPLPRALFHPVTLVVIGVSTGGPNALADVLCQFSRPLTVPILIVQHMPAGFTLLLAERLNTKCVMPVCEVVANQALEPGRVYLAPGDYHLEVSGPAHSAHAVLSQGPTENGCRPAVDVLFQSAAKVFGSGCLAVIMTGMGKDGLVGCRAIVAANGQCLAQNKESCVVWGMPKFVTESGLAQEVPLAQLGRRIEETIEQGRACR